MVMGSAGGSDRPWVVLRPSPPLFRLFQSMHTHGTARCSMSTCSTPLCSSRQRTHTQTQGHSRPDPAQAQSPVPCMPLLSYKGWHLRLETPAAGTSILAVDVAFHGCVGCAFGSRVLHAGVTAARPRAAGCRGRRRRW